LGSYSRLKLRLSDRYGVWPFPQSPDKVTAAQLILLAVALSDEPEEDEEKETGQPLADRELIEKLALAGGAKLLDDVDPKKAAIADFAKSRGIRIVED
jgi:hypothetical protein